MWSEDVASRGRQEIASCLLKHLNNSIEDDTQNVILYSDSCGGQNRNIKLTLMLKRLLSDHPRLKTITQKFFISGHSFNSCDRSFAVIEKATKTAAGLYTPEQWMSLVAQAKKSEPKFTVIKMEKEDFYGSSRLEQMIVNRKKDIDKNKINWFTFRSFGYSKEHLFSLFVNDSIEINIKKKSVDEASFNECEMEFLYPDGRLIDQKKFQDLQDLLKYIPKENHAFYQNLQFNLLSVDYGLASDSDSDD